MAETTIQSNLLYFEDSIKNKEQLIGLDYHGFVNHIVIPTKSTEKNDLTDANDKIIINIDTIETLIENFSFLEFFDNECENRGTKFYESTYFNFKFIFIC